MGVTLERVQFKFASIIGELCSEPRVLSQFAVWLDLRLAEYKLRGSISLECSNEKPDPTWMNGIKDERPPETVLPYGVAGNKSKRKLRDLPYSNNTAQRHQSSRAMTYPSVSAENLTFQRPDHQIHSIDIPDHVSSSPVGRNQSFTDLPTDHTENRLSQSGPVKQEVVENSPVFPVAMISSNELRSTLTSKSAPSTNRRKRQPSAIVRNTSAQLLLGSNFASPGSSEDDPMPDSYFSSASPSKMCKVTEASAAQSTSETVTETDSSMCDLSKAEEFPVDSTTSSPMTAGQSEAVPQPPGGGDVPSTLSREDNSTFIPPVADLSWYRGSYDQKYSRGSRGFFETPDQKKLRLRELAKMRQRRCRERQRIRRLLATESSTSFKTEPSHNDSSLSFFSKVSSDIGSNPDFHSNRSSCSDIYSTKDNGLAANFSVSE